MHIKKAGLLEQTLGRRTELLFVQAKVTCIGNALMASLVCAIYWQMLNPELLISWLLAVFIVVLLRWSLCVRFSRRNRYSTSTGWYNAYNRNALANGVAWGAMFFYTSVSLNTQSLTAFIAILGALAACANVAYNSSLNTYLRFVLPALLPAITYMVLFGHADKLVLTAIASSWFILMYSFAKQLNAHVDTTSGYETHNLALLGELDTLRRASVDLQEEIALKSRIIDRLCADLGTDMRQPGL